MDGLWAYHLETPCKQVVLPLAVTVDALVT